jgi:acyl-CoA thioesterase-2
MHPVLDDLITLLKLERIEKNIFRGDSRDIGSAQVFGGQVLGQALSAAQHTVEGRVAHSLHAYFLRRGDMKAPIVYEVDRARDGGSFSNRRVVAIQHGRPILNLAASFQEPEPGLDHQAEMPDVLGPDGLKDLSELAADHLDKIPEKMRRYMTDKRPFDFRPVEALSFDDPQPQEPRKHVWIRTVDKVPDDHALHQNLLAYVSDFELIGTSTLPHGLPFGRGKIIMARCGFIARSKWTTGCCMRWRAPMHRALAVSRAVSCSPRTVSWSRRRPRKALSALLMNPEPPVQTPDCRSDFPDPSLRGAQRRSNLQSLRARRAKQSLRLATNLIIQITPFRIASFN